MNKKLIRLTESDLHRIVKESVNKVLTELDWKTYANAEKKANGKRAQDFRKAKIDAFNRDFSATREPERISNDMYDGYTSKDTYEMKPQKIRLTPWQSEDLPTYERDGKYKRALNSNGKYFNPDDGFDDTFDDINWSLKGYDEFGKKSKMGDKDFRDYSQGKSKYVKGQGWQ